MRSTRRTTLTQPRLLTRLLLLGLTSAAALGCTHAGATRAQHRLEIAGAMAQTGATTLDSQRSASPDGFVDLSELPTVVDAGDAATSDPASSLADHRFAPGVMLAATEPVSWIDDAFDDTVVQIELRNACAIELDYAFAPRDAPGEVETPRRVLGAHTIQTQLIPQGDWLHLWDGDRWLAAGVTTVERGQMEVSADCDTLEVTVDLPERGPTRFAIQWELDDKLDDKLDDDTDTHGGPASSSPEATALSVEHRDAPERWGLDEDDDARVELRLANLCAEPVDYVFTPDIEHAPASASTIPGHTERRVEIPADWWLRYQALDEVWRGGATTSLAGAVIWLASDCVDFGVADGQFIAAQAEQPSSIGGSK